MCKDGHCSNTWGKCEASSISKGKRLGPHAVRFEKPYDAKKPYLGVGSASSWGERIDTLAAVGRSESQWNLVQTPNGFVRFESIEMPGKVMHIYENRRRRTDDGRRRRMLFVEEEGRVAIARHANASDSTKGSAAKIQDDDDLWPIVSHFESVTPIQASFQVFQINGPSNGLEIWDPEHRVAISSADPGWYFEDDVAENGVAECRSDGVGGCHGHEIVTFDPPLPQEAYENSHKIDVFAITVLTWWQGVFVLLTCGIFWCCMGGCYFHSMQNYYET